jgi:hypothetical protein
MILLGAATLVLRVFEFAGLNCRWDFSSYASISWLLLGLLSLQLVTDWADTVVLTIMLFGKHVRAGRFMDVAESADYWNFVVGSAAVGGSFYISSRVGSRRERMATGSQLQPGAPLAPTPSSPANLFALWWGILIGPLAWATDLGISYPMTHSLCEFNNAWAFHAISVCTLALAVSGALVAHRELALVPRAPGEKLPRPIERSRFMAHLGIAVSVLFMIVILAESVAELGISPCQ